MKNMNNSSIGENNIIKNSALVDASEIGNNNKIYMNARVRKSSVYSYCSVGDFSIIDFSKLKDYVRVQRYNNLYNSIIKDHSYTGMNTVIMNSIIGKYCSISWGVSIGPANHDYRRVTSHSFLYDDYDDMKPKKEIAYNRFNEKTIIGNDVWIGCNSTILKGVKIGTGAVIGANVLVNKEVPPYAIVVGNPAKIIKYRFNKQVIKKLLEIEWWNFSEKVIKENYTIFSGILNEETLENLIELKKIHSKGNNNGTF